MSHTDIPDLTARPQVWSHGKFLCFQSAFWVTGTLALWFMIATYRPTDTMMEIILSRSSTGIILTSILHWVYRFSWLRKSDGHIHLLRIIGVNLAAAILSSALWMALLHWTSLQEFETANRFQSITLSRLSSLLIWNTMYFGYEYMVLSHAARLAAARAVAAAKVAELNRLQAQLNPHFLFNALSTIKASLGDPPLAEQVTQDLADLLRFSLEHTEPLAPLERELEIAECYLRIQAARFEDAMVYEIQTSPAAIRARVPPMLIQPLLENAFKYGAKTSAKPLRVEVHAHTIGATVCISVTNSGNWIAEGREPSLGTGLTNLRRRLNILSDGKASLEIRKEESSVTVDLKFPLLAHVRPSQPAIDHLPCSAP
jgi:hypothetical protein